MLETFECLSELPVELYLIIWKSALPPKPHATELVSHPISGFISSRPPPLLFVCAQSREVARKHYRKVESSYRTRIIYFSPFRKYLHIDASCRGCWGLCFGHCNSVRDIRIARENFEPFDAGTAQVGKES
jgi:hypothetical protein